MSQADLGIRVRGWDGYLVGHGGLKNEWRYVG